MSDLYIMDDTDTLESRIDTVKNALRQSVISLVDDKINDILLEYKKYLDGYDNHYTQLRDECQSRINHLEYLLKDRTKFCARTLCARLDKSHGRKGGSFSKYKTRKRIKKINNIKIKKHAKKHTRRHMIHMKKMMKKGYSFKNAHKSAMYKVGK